MLSREQVREVLLQQCGNTCSHCGGVFDNEQLIVDHIIPYMFGGETSPNNMRIVCRNCDSRANSVIRGYEFQYTIARLLQNNNSYRNIQIEKSLEGAKHISADIVAEEINNGVWRRIVIECKSQSTLSLNTLTKLIDQIMVWKRYDPNAKLILAFPGKLSERSAEYISRFNIEIWDVEFISSNFRDQLEDIDAPFLKSLLQKAIIKKGLPSPEERLIYRLKNCRPGRDEWSKYQSLVGEILERLFVPPLSSPLKELSDASKVNRRDFVFPNYAPDGYWAFLRNQYSADYVVVDAKNYSRKIKKQEILQISNYLKPYGAGLFAIIVCRIGGDNSALLTLREVWACQRKLILILTDNDIEQMLKDKSFGLYPEDLIRDKIRDFRLEL